ncbi:MAG: hypothetical protein RRC34_08045 [Lentisphaeria bacterium]|nr:hypothetical protein [Lentisphaeria bacterium]
MSGNPYGPYDCHGSIIQEQNVSPTLRYDHRSITFDRHGSRVSSTIKSEIPIKSAALHYTTDSGEWKQRKWLSIPAEYGEGIVKADLPKERGITFFLTVVDERGATVTTEHKVIQVSR